MTPVQGDTNVPSYGSLVSLDPQGATPPLETYIKANDSLEVVAFNAVANLIVTVSARMLLPDGSIVQNKWPFTPASDRSSSVAFFPLTEGFLLSLQVTGSSGSNSFRTYVQVRLVQGAAANATVGWILVCGYISPQRLLSWPPGILENNTDGQGSIFTITGTTPGAGAEISEVVPAHARWKLLAFRFQLTTAVTVATRQADLVMDDGANIFAEVIPGTTQAASLVQIYNYLPNVNVQPVANGIVNAPIPNDVFLSSGFRIRTHTFNLQAGDQYTAPQYVVQEWLVD
jgi:hypothetical protein